MSPPIVYPPTAWLSITHVPGLTDSGPTTTVGVFSSEEQANQYAGYGRAIPLPGYRRHCRLRSRGGVYFTRRDQSFGELWSLLVEAYPELV